MGSATRCGLLLFALQAAAAIAAAPPEMYSVPLPVSAPRLLGMSMDDDGFVWLGSTSRAIWRYDPRTGAIEEIKLPFDSSTSQTICVGKKVYLLGQKYPKLMCYDRESRSFSELAYPTATPDVWETSRHTLVAPACRLPMLKMSFPASLAATYAVGRLPRK